MCLGRGLPGELACRQPGAGSRLFELGRISESMRDPETVFMAGTWAECPAMNFVPALYRAVWEAALAAEKAEKRT